MIRLALVVGLLWSVVAFGQASRPAVEVWDADWVEFGASPSARQSDVNGKASEQPAGAYQARTHRYREQPERVGPVLDYTYQNASRGRLPTGNSVICCAGVLFPLNASFEVVEYVREGKEIRLVLRHSPADKPVLKKPGRATQVQLFAQAEIPITLEKGEYDFVFTVIGTGAQGRGVSAGPVRTTVRIPPPLQDNVDLKALSDEELLQEYVARGEACKGTGVRPTDGRSAGGASMIEFEHPARVQWDRAAHEIRRRGSEIIPELMAMLPAEVQRNAGDDSDGKFGFGYELIDMMGEAGDPRPVPLLVDVLGGQWDSNTWLREISLRSLQKLTYVRFYGPGDLQSGPPQGLSLVHRERLPKRPWFEGRSKKDYIAQMAPLYRAWLRDEGPDPTQWLSIARKRAREILAGDDAEEIMEAIAFLQNDGRDDAPEKTLDSLIRLFGEARRTPGGQYPQYEWRGKPLPMPGNWFEFFPHYGSDARRAVPLMIQRMEAWPPNWGFIRYLETIGGVEAMEYCVGKLPELARAAEGQPEMDESGERSEPVLALAACRWAIERMAGRTFGNDDEIRTWWEENRDVPPRQWLEDSLMLTAQKADGGDARAQYLLRKLVPDLPNAEGDLRWFEPGHGGSRRPAGAPLAGPYRVKWLQENRAKLRFDEKESVFRLVMGESEVIID